MTEKEQAEQLELTLQGLVIDYSEPVRPVTAEKAMRERPEVCDAALNLMALKIKWNIIATKLHFDTRTLHALHAANIKEVAARRQYVQSMSFQAAAVLGNRVLEEAHKMSGKDAAIGFGIFTDKFAMLAGQPTMHIEVNHKFDLGAALKKLEDDALEIMKTARAHVVEPPQLEDGSPA